MTCYLPYIDPVTHVGSLRSERICSDACRLHLGLASHAPATADFLSNKSREGFKLSFRERSRPIRADSRSYQLPFARHSASFQRCNVGLRGGFDGRQQIRGRLEWLARSFRATSRSIELPVDYKKPAIDDGIGKRQKIIVTKQPWFEFIPFTRVKWIASIQCCSMAIERNGLVDLA